MNLTEIIEKCVREKIQSMTLAEIIKEIGSPIILDKIETPALPDETETECSRGNNGKKRLDGKDGPYQKIKDNWEEFKKGLINGDSAAKIAKKMGISPGAAYQYLGENGYSIKKIRAEAAKKAKEEDFLRINPEQTSLSILDITDCTRQTLKDHGIHMISDLIKLHPSELFKINGIGKKKVDDIFLQLADYGLTFNYGQNNHLN